MVKLHVALFKCSLNFHVGIALPLGGGCDTLATGDPDVDDKEQDTPIFEKHDNLLHGEVNKRYISHP